MCKVTMTAVARTAIVRRSIILLLDVGKEIRSEDATDTSPNAYAVSSGERKRM
jgi:hypothetical protein